MSATDTNDDGSLPIDSPPTRSDPSPAFSPSTPPGFVFPDNIGLQSTPHKATVTTNRTSPDDNAYRVKIAEEMATSFGSRPIDSWYDFWLPGETLDFSKDKLPPEFAEKKFHFNDLIFDDKQDGHIKNEDELYPKLCEVIQNVLDLARHQTGQESRVLIKDTAGWSESSGTDSRPDGGLYLESDQEAFQLTKNELDNSKFDAVRKPYMARTAYSKCLVPLEIKFRRSTDGFRVDKTGKLILPDGVDSIRTRGQLFDYCTTIFGRQPREHLFALHIYRNMATLVALDRVSASVAIPFDYVKEPLKLLTFFYRAAKSDLSALGYDPTMTPASEDEIAMLYESLPDCDKEDDLTPDEQAILQAFRDVRIHGPRSIWPIYKVSVTDKKKDNVVSTHEFLVSKPRTKTPSLYGRGSKGYIAFNLERHDFAFLKDSWRADAPKIRPEFEVYKRMEERGVTQEHYVATMQCGGDVRGDTDSGVQRTRSQKLLTKATSARIHCRLVLNEIAHPLSTYVTSSHLVSLVLRALFAHERVWTLAGILHGDVSDNNIMVVWRNGSMSGILIDWDLCKYIEDLTTVKVRNGNRSGTWPFISALRLQYPKKPRELSDDIESFIHVILWHALCYHEHDLSSSGTDLTMLIQTWFLDIQQDEDRLYYGCRAKFMAILSGQSPAKMNDPIFDRLIRDLLGLAQQHYSAIDLDAWDKYRPRRPFVQKRTVAKSDRQKSVQMTEDPVMNIDDTTDDTIFTCSAIKSNPAFTLKDHKKLFVLLTRYLNMPEGWEGEEKTPDQFKELPNVNIVKGPRAVIGTDTSRTKTSSSRKRQADGIPETKSRPKSKKSRTTASGGAVSSSCGLTSVREESEGGNDLESEEEA